MRFRDFLSPRFKEEVLDRLPSSIAALDVSGNILWVNSAWDAFARQNGFAPPEDGWGSYFGAITPDLRAYYEDAFGRALATGTVFEQEYECSSPDVLRRFHLRALPFEGRVLVAEHVAVFEAVREEHGAQPVIEQFASESGTIAQCGNCRRTYHRSSGAYRWVPEWVKKPHPKTSHVICPSCERYYYHRPKGSSVDGT